MTLTKRQRRIKTRYVFRDCDHRVSLVVGNQSFLLCCEWESKKQAEWMRDMLAKALSKLVEEER